MGQDFVLNDGGVVPYVDVFNSDGWDLGDKNAPERICYRGVYTDEGEA